MWSMFHNGKFIIDLKFSDFPDIVVKVHDKKWVSLDGKTEYYLFKDGGLSC